MHFHTQKNHLVSSNKCFCICWQSTIFKQYTGTIYFATEIWIFEIFWITKFKFWIFCSVLNTENKILCQWVPKIYFANVLAKKKGFCVCGQITVKLYKLFRVEIRNIYIPVFKNWLPKTWLQKIVSDSTCLFKSWSPNISPEGKFHNLNPKILLLIVWEILRAFGNCKRSMVSKWLTDLNHRFNNRG